MATAASAVPGGSVDLALEGCTVIVTGAGSGIGAATARLLGAAGASVVLVGRREAPLRQSADAVEQAGGRAVPVPADLADSTSPARIIAAALAAFGRIDGLVNNAGRTLVGPFLDVSAEDWDDVLRTDLTAAFHTCRAAIPSMVAQGSGSIVNLASRLGQMGIPETAAYSAAKAGLIGLTRALATEFGPRGVRVNAVAPAVTVTDMTTDLVDSEEGRRRLRGMPLGRFGRSDEVADAVVFLLSDRAALFLGQTLNPNGGGYMP
jgi:3-oxoacyl-[acyl-carrier protein] reductase